MAEWVRSWRNAFVPTATRPSPIRQRAPDPTVDTAGQASSASFFLPASAWQPTPNEKHRVEWITDNAKTIEPALLFRNRPATSSTP